MGKLTIKQPPECYSLYIDNHSKREFRSDNETICEIKDNYYRVMDGLNGLLGVLDEKQFCNELKTMSIVLKKMSKTNLERLWMKSANK